MTGKGKEEKERDVKGGGRRKGKEEKKGDVEEKGRRRQIRGHQEVIRQGM